MLRALSCSIQELGTRHSMYVCMVAATRCYCRVLHCIVCSPSARQVEARTSLFLRPQLAPPGRRSRCGTVEFGRHSIGRMVTASYGTGTRGGGISKMTVNTAHASEGADIDSMPPVKLLPQPLSPPSSPTSTFATPARPPSTQDSPASSTGTARRLSHSPDQGPITSEQDTNSTQLRIRPDCRATLLLFSKQAVVFSSLSSIRAVFSSKCEVQMTFNPCGDAVAP